MEFMEKDIISNQKGIVISKGDNGINFSLDSKHLFFPNAELLNAGCRNCVWKIYHQCPYGLVEEQSYPADLEENKKSGLEEAGFPRRAHNPENAGSNPASAIEGICLDMISFLVSLADKNDTLISIWEKFHIYKARLQESEDFKDFKQLEERIRQKEKTLARNGFNEEEVEQLNNLRMDKTAAKLWWMKLNQHVIQSMQKVVDREAEAKGAVRLPGIQSTGTINFNIIPEKKLLEEK